MGGRTACGARGLALQEATATINRAAQGTGPGEGPGKCSTWAVARAGGLGTSCKLLQLVGEGDRLIRQEWHYPVSNLALPLEFFKAICHPYSCRFILTLEVTLQISIQI